VDVMEYGVRRKARQGRQRRGICVDYNRVQRVPSDNRSESGRNDDEGMLGQMAVESVGREACLERCWIVTLRRGVLVIHKDSTRTGHAEKDVGDSKRRGDGYNSVYSQDSRVVGESRSISNSRMQSEARH
jgi:hypothetical protein